jgi:AraC-like DNA-binding protein
MSGHLGLRAHQWLERMKAVKASALLGMTRLRIHEVAERVGYTDPYYFSKAFKRITGVSPSAYRRSRRRSPE